MENYVETLLVADEEMYRYHKRRTEHYLLVVSNVVRSVVYWRITVVLLAGLRGGHDMIQLCTLLMDIGRCSGMIWERLLVFFHFCFY